MNTGQRQCWRTALPLVLWAVTAATAHAEGAYRFTDLGASGNYSSGYAVDRHGAVAGISARDRIWSATLWQHGKITTLGEPSPELGNCRARGINGDGAVVGECGIQAMLWKGGMATVLPPLDGRFGVAFAINEAGWVVGHSSVSLPTGVPFHATMWIDGTPIDLGTLPGGSLSEAHAINDKGHVAGYSYDRQDRVRATVWRGAKVVNLGTLGGLHSVARALNGRGQVVGDSGTSQGHSHAALWDGKAATDLGTLPGGDFSGAAGINNEGVAVGFSFVTKDQKFLDQRATMWKGGAIIDLNTLLDDETRAAGWLLLVARAINDHGVITGVATNTTVNDTRAFLLTPPAP